MSLREFYKPLCDSLSREHLEKVGSFAGEFLHAKTLGDTDRMVEMIKSATASLANDPDTLDTFLGIINYSVRYGTPTEKTAAAKLASHFSEIVREEHEKVAALDFNKGVALAGLGVAATPLIMHLADKVSTNSKIKSAMRQIMADHPELREDPNTPRYFQALVDFSPKVAANPIAAGNIMKQLHQVGPGALTPSLIKELSDISKSQSEIRKVQSEPFGSGARAVQTAGELLTRRGTP